MDWTQIKDGIETATGLSRDALHIYSALFIQVASAALLRRRLSDWLPWLIVLILATANEYFDGYADSELERWEAKAGVHDLWNTMVIPTALLLLTRFAPNLAARTPAEHELRRPKADPAGTDAPSHGPV